MIVIWSRLLTLEFGKILRLIKMKLIGSNVQGLTGFG